MAWTKEKERQLELLVAERQRSHIEHAQVWQRFCEEYKIPHFVRELLIEHAGYVRAALLPYEVDD